MRKHVKLRTKMTECDVVQDDIACAIGRNDSYVSQRMNGNHPWTIADIYTVCKLLHIPEQEIYLYFPDYGNGKKGRMERAS